MESITRGCILKWKIKLKDDNSLRLSFNKFHKGKLKIKNKIKTKENKQTKKHFVTEFKDNGWIKMSMEKYGGTGFVENSLKTDSPK